MSDPTRRSTRAGAGSPGSPAARAGSAGSSASRAGRRERTRTTYRKTSFVERYQTQLIVAGAILLGAIVLLFLFIGSTQKSYACSSLLDPASPSPGPSGSPRLGQQERDMGNSHIPVGQSQRYTYCPPASGSHYFAANQGPIAARYYGPDDGTVPQGWIHNLEHGALVVLYNCAGGCPDDATLQKLKSFATSFPPSPICHLRAGVIGPVITRFDDMKTKYAAIVWDRVLLLDSPDTDQILAFFQTEGERANPEKQCAAPSPGTEPSTAPSGSAGASPAPSGSAGASPAPSGSAAASPSS